MSSTYDDIDIELKEFGKAEKKEDCGVTDSPVKIADKLETSPSSIASDEQTQSQDMQRKILKYIPRVVPLLSPPLMTGSALANYFNAPVVGGSLSNFSTGLLFFANGISILNNNRNIEEDRKQDEGIPTQPIIFGRKSAVSVAMLNFAAGLSIIASVVLTALDEDKDSNVESKFSSYIVGLVLSQLAISFLAGISVFIQNRQMNAFSKETKRQLSITIQNQKEEIRGKDSIIEMKNSELHKEKLNSIYQNFIDLREYLDLFDDRYFAIWCKKAIIVLERLSELNDHRIIQAALKNLSIIQQKNEDNPQNILDIKEIVNQVIEFIKGENQHSSAPSANIMRPSHY